MKAMMHKKMLHHKVQFMTMQMNQGSTTATFAMEKKMFLGNFLPLPHIFKAGRAVLVDKVFVYQTFFTKPFQLPVNRGGSHGLPLFTEMTDKLRYREMLSL
jgi:hypothetical protein